MSKGKGIPKWLRVVIPGALLLVWFTLGGIGGPYFGKISEVTSNDQATFLPASAEATKVNKEIEKFQEQKSLPAIIVFSDDNNQLTENQRTDIKAATEKLSNLSEVSGKVSPPIVSDDGKAALVVVNLNSNTEFKEFVPKLQKQLDQANLQVEYQITGPIGFIYDLSKAFGGIDGILLAVALGVVFIILLLVYRSPILPFVVLLNSIFALSASILVVYYLAQADLITVNGQVQGILFILVIGAATDYALLFVARYKEELEKKKEVYQAIVKSWKSSFEPIVAAGGTVIAGLLCLLLSDLNSNRALGPVGAIGVAMAVLSALTLLPSLLMIWGRKVFWPFAPKYQLVNMPKITEKGLWPHVGKFVSKNPRKIWIVTTLVLLIGSLGLLNIRAEGVSQSDLILGKSEARDGQKILNKHFPDGSGTPAEVVVSSNKMNDVVAKFESDKGVSSVSALAVNSVSGSVPLGKAKSDIKQKIRQQAGAANSPYIESIVANAYPFKDATPKVVDDRVVLQVTLSDNSDSTAARTTVERLRQSVRTVDSAARIGGSTAIQLDTQNGAKHDRAVIIPIVLIVITIILMLLLRSILAPVLLLLTTILSFAATLGISSFIFNDLLNFPGADPTVVLFGFIFLVALGIDYNIFLMTRVREESLKHGTRKGVIRGLVVTGGVITSAGIVLASTFAALAVIPILFLAQLAFIVAFGVLLDTIVVRSLLVPALVYDFGKTVWWPSKKIKS